MFFPASCTVSSQTRTPLRKCDSHSRTMRWTRLKYWCTRRTVSSSTASWICRCIQTARRHTVWWWWGEGFKGSPPHFYLCGNVLIGGELDEKQPRQGKRGENVSFLQESTRSSFACQEDVVLRRVTSECCTLSEGHMFFIKTHIGQPRRRKSENHFKIKEVWICICEWSLCFSNQ